MAFPPAMEGSRCLTPWLSGSASWVSWPHGVLGGTGTPVPQLYSVSLLGPEHMVPCMKSFPGVGCSSPLQPFPRAEGVPDCICKYASFFAVLVSCGFNFLILFFQIRLKSV